MATERSLTVGGGHMTQCVFALLLNCPRETYWIVLINVTIKKKKRRRKKRLQAGVGGGVHHS